MSDTKTCKVIILPLGKLTKELCSEVAWPVKKNKRFSFFFLLSLSFFKFKFYFFTINQCDNGAVIGNS